MIFNTSPDDELSPIGVNGDCATGTMPEGIDLSEEDANAYMGNQNRRLYAEKCVKLKGMAESMKVSHVQLIIPVVVGVLPQPRRYISVY